MITLRQWVPFVFTAGAMLSGFLSIIQAAQGAYLLAAQLILLSMVLDGFDGNLARKLNVCTPLGAELDTFVDIMSFGISPALLAYWVALEQWSWFGLLLPVLMVGSGMTRLARFRIINPDRGNKGYTGLPITANAAWVAIMVYGAESQQWPWGREALVFGWGAALIWGISLLMVLLQVSHVHYSKPTKHWILFIPMALSVFMLLWDVKIGAAIGMAMLLYGLFYVFISPWLKSSAVVPEELETES